MKIPVAELIVRFMERLGIERAFGMPGAHILPVYDHLRASCIGTVLAKHEQGAAFMAGGHVRASGRLAACVTTAGPGATNLVTGIASAYLDRLPVLIVTGETPTYVFGKGGLQEGSGEGGAIDLAALFAGITRYHKVVERTDYLPQVLNQAARALRAPDPGPVLLSLPYNVQKELVEADLLDAIALPDPFHAGCGCPREAEALAGLIAEAEYPVIVAGHGCIESGAQEVLAELAGTLGIPVATTLKGKGVIAEDSDLALGTLGVTSDGDACRYIVEAADLVLFVGAGFNERTSYLWDRKLLGGKTVAQVDRDAGQLEKVFKADLAIRGDAAEVLAAVLAAARAAGAGRKSLDRLAGRRGPGGGSAATDPRFALAKGFFARLADRFPAGAMVFDDNIVFAQNFLPTSPGIRYFPNSGISALGHAVPAAIGARFAREGAAFAVLGDGGFQMCGFELMTAVNYGLPVNAVVFNNATLGLIRKNQCQLYGGRLLDCDFTNPDFGLLARSFGIRHHRIEAEADLDRLFAEADLTGAINLIEILLDKDAFPSYLSDR